MCGVVADVNERACNFKKLVGNWVDGVNVSRIFWRASGSSRVGNDSNFSGAVYSACRGL